MSGGPAVLAGCAAVSLWQAIRALLRGRRPSFLALAALLGLAGYIALVRPWTRAWGATQDETSRPLPGDELVSNPGVRMTRAVTIDAPPDAVWPWLAQIGQDRAGFYSYAWLENLAGCDMRNADRVHEEWQQREIGEAVLLHPADGVPIARFERNRSYAFAGGWYFVLEAIDAQHTRLIARTRVPRGLPSIAYATFIELPHFVMERKMLLGIKERAERRRTGSGV